ncbi:MAG: hypothetical protein COA79_05345 [Planctomycetota bacterium]|nr:MAG: hypothetical protein COA79_05345 [Planctomycetota bacterium]
MYCKIPLVGPSELNPEDFDFILHRNVSQKEAEKLKVSLIMRGFNSVVARADDATMNLYNVLISEKDKGDVFRLDSKSSTSKEFDLKSGEKHNSFFNIFIMILVILLSGGLYYYFNDHGKDNFKEPVTVYEGYVDPRISSRKSYSSKQKKVKKINKVKGKAKKIEPKKTKNKTKPQN